MSVFGDYHIRLEPWEDVEYAPERPDIITEDAIEDIVLDVELNPRAWRPVIPGNVCGFQAVHFVDSVRRIDARLLVQKATRLCHGAFGCTAVGAVQVTAGGTRCTEPVIERLVPIGSGEQLPAPVVAGRDLVYLPATCPESDADAPLRAVQRRMREIEETVVHRLTQDERSLVVVDGPLSYAHPVRGNVVGYIKRIVQLCLPTKFVPLVADLPVGGRTPLFVITHMKRGRYSWFQRISPPDLGESYLTGIARMEVSSQIGPDAGRHLADAVTALLPRYVSPPARDPRTSRGLLPIGALEGNLRRCLGDAGLTRRRIRSVITIEAKHG